MADRRRVDQLSIEELEQVIALRRREMRQAQLNRMSRQGRRVNPADMARQIASTERRITLDDGELTGNAGYTMSAPPGYQGPGAASLTDENSQRKRKKPASEEERIWRTFLSRSFLTLEVAAVVGLLVVGFAMFDGIGALQRQSAEAQAAAEAQIVASQPTIAPTPQLQLANIVLPSGHTPPTEPGGGQFNFDEVPENLRYLVRNQVFPTEIRRPEVTADTPRRLIIPDIGVDHVIVQGTDWEALKAGVGQVPNSVTPSDATGNVVLAAHNDIYGEIFRYLDRLEPGMEFQVQTDNGFYTYVISGTDIVAPNEVQVMESQGRPTATLISCYPYQVNTQRYIIYAERLDDGNLTRGDV